MSDQQWIVQVIDAATEEVVKTMTRPTERAADKLADGVSINLDHDRYYVTVQAPVTA